MRLKLISALLIFFMLALFIIACTDVTPPEETPVVTPTVAPEPTPQVTPDYSRPTLPPHTPATETKVDLEGVSEFTFTEVLHVNVGNGNGELGYGTEVGPQDFLVREDGSICILDSINDRILIFDDGACIETVSIFGNSEPFYVFSEELGYYDGMFYVLDTINNFIVVVSDPAVTGNQTIEVIDLPSGTDAISMSVDSTGIFLAVFSSEDTNATYANYFKPHDAEKFVYKAQGKYQMDGSYPLRVRIGDDKWELPQQSFDNFSYILGSDTKGNLYLCEYGEFEKSSTHYSRCVYAFDKDGILFGYAYIDFREFAAYPASDTAVASDGSVYHMHCLEGYVSIQKVTFDLG